MKKISPGEEFSMGGVVFIYELSEGSIKLKRIRDAKQKAKSITTPTEQEVKEYAIQNGYSPEFMWEKMKAYIDNDMKDSRGTVIKNWKMKLNQVWFKPENKLKENKQGISFFK